MKKILVIDNEEIIVDMIGIYLQEQGFTIVPCYGGEEAMDILEQDKGFDLILLDIMMPNVSGFDVLDFMNRNPQLSKIPIIVATAKMDDSMQKEKLEKSKNVKAYILKPFEMETLKREIDKIYN